MRTLAGALALIERGDDRAVKRHRAGVVAHAGDRARRRGVLIGAHQIHQARARPIGVAVETGLVGLLALFAVAGERAIDQTLVERVEFLVGDAKPLSHRGGKIRDEDIGLGDEAIQHRLSLRLGEVERKALLVAGFQHPREIERTVRVSRQVRQVAIGIACYRRLDLDHVGAEIRQHGCGRGRRDETRAVQNLEAFENALFHCGVAPVTLVGFVRIPELSQRTIVNRFHLTRVGSGMQRHFLTLPWRGRVGSHGAKRNANRGGVTVSQLGHRSKRETVTPPRRSFHSRRPSPSRGGCKGAHLVPLRH